jgi:phosphoserine phosphatase
MFVLQKGRVAYFDVDDTLLEWDESKNKDAITINLNGMVSKKLPLKKNIQELIKQYKSGTRIIVWSASGACWAESVVKALNLEEYVDAILTKPDRYYDDKDVLEWFPQRRFYQQD